MSRHGRHLALSLLTLCLLVACRAKPAAEAEAGQGETLLLWPGVAPGSSGLTMREVVTERSQDPKQRDRALSGIAAGVSAELHIYERGGHGFGLRSPPGAAVEGWAELALRWLNRRGSGHS